MRPKFRSTLALTLERKLMIWQPLALHLCRHCLNSSRWLCTAFFTPAPYILQVCLHAVTHVLASLQMLCLSLMALGWYCLPILSEIFELRRKYNVPVYMCLHPELREYVATMLSARRDDIDGSFVFGGGLRDWLTHVRITCLLFACYIA
eukprot:SAG31_NODE_205_length_20397_cov_19.191152_7_plen_149_part_00